MSDLEAHVDTCPFCRRPMGDKRKKLYDHAVCAKCFYAFANRRQLAFVIDRVVWVLPTLAVTAVVGLIVGALGQTVTPEMARSIDLLSWPLYIVFLLKDGFHGYSPGKWICGVQTIDKTTHEAAGFLASLKRNLPIYVPIVPLIVAFQLQYGKRWGDGWANTRVIWKKYEHSHVFGALGCCEVCQYDLRGNVSGVCPECGTPVSAVNRELLVSHSQQDKEPSIPQ